LRSRTSALVLAALAAAAACRAAAPSIGDLDAAARAAGNRRDVAIRIGQAIFRTSWSAEVNQVSANEVGRHLIVGIRMWGVKFHHPLSRILFVGEVVALASDVFRAAPATEEIDFWTSVPLEVGRGEVVSGDLARPTSRTVFSVTVRRSEPLESLRERALHGGSGVYWDRDWMRSALGSSG
jgi:hypothetical protein